MGISKAWLQEKIIEAKTNYDKYSSGVERGRYNAFQECFDELTKAPIPKKKLTDEEINKGYDSIVKYYVDKKGYTKEHANEIAMKCIEDQKQKVLQQK